MRTAALIFLVTLTIDAHGSIQTDFGWAPESLTFSATTNLEDGTVMNVSTQNVPFRREGPTWINVFELSNASPTAPVTILFGRVVGSLRIQVGEFDASVPERLDTFSAFPDEVSGDLVVVGDGIQPTGENVGGSLTWNSIDSSSLSFVFRRCTGCGLWIEEIEVSCAGGLDTDNDGVSDALDNCLSVANVGQDDSDSDGFGNHCDSDIAPVGANDCLTNFTDLNLLKNSFFSNPSSPTWNPDADLNVDGQVNFGDLSIMKEQFFGRPGTSCTVNACDAF